MSPAVRCISAATLTLLLWSPAFALADEAPAISASGIIAVQTVIGNESSFSIATCTRAGGTAIQVTDDAASDLYPTWSPDGTRITCRIAWRIHRPLDGKAP